MFSKSNTGGSLLFREVVTLKGRDSRSSALNHRFGPPRFDCQFTPQFQFDPCCASDAPNEDAFRKAIILGTAFLIDYMYFENKNNN